jgi:hypothetical protein
MTAACALLFAPPASMSEEASRSEDMLILDAGAAGEKELAGGSTRLGPALGIEIEAIESRLEVELGAARFEQNGSTVWNVDLSFKKPWRLSERLEIMPGLGPTWEHANARQGQVNFWGIEGVVDLFFWCGRRLGLFVEPAYGVGFNGGGRSLGLTAGVFTSI